MGENKPFQVNVRVLSATNADLQEAIDAGTFREDLYHRLKVVTVDLPKLSERRDDILPMNDFFRKQFGKRHHKTVKNITPAVINRFFSFEWTGNVRQLRNVVETMVVLDADGILDLDDLPPELVEDSVESRPSDEGKPWDLVGKPMAEIERWAIQETLKLTNGNREEAARTLKIGARTLYRKLKEFDET